MCDAASFSRVLQPEDRQRRDLNLGSTLEGIRELAVISSSRGCTRAGESRVAVRGLWSYLALGKTPSAEIRLLGLLFGFISNGMRKGCFVRLRPFLATFVLSSLVLWHSCQWRPRLDILTYENVLSY
jgi:hypothetical protein